MENKNFEQGWEIVFRRLVQSTLATIASYYMQATFRPKHTLESIDKSCDDFSIGKCG